ncbi:MAG: UDP binding domain-containing protein, partial [Rhodospirillales bacterium]
AKKLLSGVTYCAGAYEAIEGADVMAIVTEWNEFRALDLKRIKSLMKRPALVDLRNIYNPQEMANAGFIYTCLGRRTAAAQA